MDYPHTCHWTVLYIRRWLKLQGQPHKLSRAICKIITHSFTLIMACYVWIFEAYCTVKVVWAKAWSLVPTLMLNFPGSTTQVFWRDQSASEEDRTGIVTVTDPPALKRKKRQPRVRIYNQGIFREYIRDIDFLEANEVLVGDHNRAEEVSHIYLIKSNLFHWLVVKNEKFTWTTSFPATVPVLWTVTVTSKFCFCPMVEDDNFRSVLETS